MKKLITCLLLVFAFQATALTLNYTFNRTANRFTFSFQPVAGRHYSLIRKDLCSGYYDTPFHALATNNNVVHIEIDPMMTGEDLNPAPSGSFWFYLVEQQ